MKSGPQDAVRARPCFAMAQDHLARREVVHEDADQARREAVGEDQDDGTATEVGDPTHAHGGARSHQLDGA